MLDTGSIDHLVYKVDLLEDAEGCVIKYVTADGGALRITSHYTELISVTVKEWLSRCDYSMVMQRIGREYHFVRSTRG